MSDYETLAELEYAFIVWRTNLKRDLSLTEDREVRASCFVHCLLHSVHARTRCPCNCHHAFSHMSPTCVSHASLSHT